MIELGAQNPDKAIQDIKKALSVDKQCVRASLMMARIHIQNHEYKQAIKYLEKVID